MTALPFKWIESEVARTDTDLDNTVYTNQHTYWVQGGLSYQKKKYFNFIVRCQRNTHTAHTAHTP
jgi:hypothetical protein